MRYLNAILVLCFCACSGFGAATRFVFRDGLSGAELGSVATANAPERLTIELANGVSGEMHTTRHDGSAEYRMRFPATAPGSEPYRITVAMQLAFDGNAESFFDGHTVHAGQPAQWRRDMTGGTFPLTALYDAGTGIAAGLTPDNVYSYFAGTATPRLLTVTTHLVLDHRAEQKLNWVAIEFKPEFGWRDAIDIYYRLYPEFFRPHPGVDSRIYGLGGYMISAREQYPLQLHAARRGNLDWEWSYAAWTRAGYWYPDAGEWRDGVDYYDWWSAPHQPKFCTYDEYHAGRTEQFTEGNTAAAMFYYILGKDIHETLTETYPEALLTMPDGTLYHAPSGFYSILSDQGRTRFSFPHGSGLGTYLENELRQATENYEISGFAFDMANHMHNTYSPSQLEYARGRAFDAGGGIYTTDTVTPLAFAEFVHTLKRGDKQMGVIMNLALDRTYAPTVFAADAVMFEGGPECHWDSVMPLRLMSGAKPFSFWNGIAGGKYCTAIRWDYNDSEAAVDGWTMINDGLAELQLLKCLELGASPMTWAAQHRQGALFGPWLPTIRRIKKLGWQPVPALKSGNDSIWTGRFGSGAETIITVSNPTRKPVTLDAELISSYLGDAAYILVAANSPKEQTQRVGADSTGLRFTLQPKEALLFQVLEVKGLDGDEFEVVTRNDDGELVISSGKWPEGATVHGEIFTPDEERSAGIAFAPAGARELRIPLPERTIIQGGADDIAGFFTSEYLTGNAPAPRITAAATPAPAANYLIKALNTYFPYMLASQASTGKSWYSEPGFFTPESIRIVDLTRTTEAETARRIYIGSPDEFPGLTPPAPSPGGFIQLTEAGLWIGGRTDRELHEAAQKYLKLLDKFNP